MLPIFRGFHPLRGAGCHRPPTTYADLAPQKCCWGLSGAHFFPKKGEKDEKIAPECRQKTKKLKILQKITKIYRLCKKNTNATNFPKKK